MEVETRNPLKGIARVQVECMKQKSEARLIGTFNSPLVRGVADRQWTQIDLNVTDVVKEHRTERRNKS